MMKSRLDGWVARRGPTRPPLLLGYRQVFILPTRFGWLLGLLMFAMLMGSLNFNNNLGLLTTFIVAGLGANSMLLAYRNLEGLRILKTGAAPVFAGQPAQFLITIASDAGRDRPGLELRHGAASQVFNLPARGITEATLPVSTRHRGWLELDRLVLQTGHPIGLFEAWSWFWPERAILVWPRPAAHPPPLPEGSADREGSEQRRNPEGDEFYSLRAWREGDPLHRVAWKASQRHNTLLARELRQPRSRDLVLDLAQAPGRDLEERISILTAWLLQASRQDRSWTLKLGGERIGPDRTQAHLHACLKALAEQ